MAATTKGAADVVINVGIDEAGAEKKTTQLSISKKMEAVIDQFFNGPELAKMLCQASFAAIFATPVIYHNQMIPGGYCLAISLLLFLGFLTLFLAISFRKAFPKAAGILALLGSAFVVSTVPIITAGVLPDHLLFVSLFFLILLLLIVLGLLWLHVHLIRQHLLSSFHQVNQVKAMKIETPSIHHHSAIYASEEEISVDETPVNNSQPDTLMNELKLNSEDVKEEVEYWNSAVVCFVAGGNPSFKAMESFLKRVWGENEIDRISMRPGGIFIVRFHDYSQALKAVDKYVVFRGKPVVVKLWEPNLVLKKEEISATVPVWIQLRGLDLKFWGSDCLNKIAGLVGKPVRFDRVTSHKERLNFARVLVEIKVNQTLPNCIYFKDEGGCEIAQNVVYEWKPYFCDYCQNFGHQVTDDCKRRGTSVKKIWVVKSNASPVVAAGDGN